LYGSEGVPGNQLGGLKNRHDEETALLIVVFGDGRVAQPSSSPFTSTLRLSNVWNITKAHPKQDS
jgi:hypothetical protein